MTKAQLQQSDSLGQTLGLIAKICIREIMAGRGRDYCLPMIRAAVDELELKFRGSPENAVDPSKN